MKTDFTPEWKIWIKTNVDAGHNKDGIFKILLDEGFDYSAIKREMNYEPAVQVEQLINPFHAASQQQAVSNHGAQIDPDELLVSNAVRYDSDKLDLYILDNFLSTDECEQIIALIRQKKQPSTLSSYSVDQSFRTSSTCHLGLLGDNFMQEINLRICRTIGIDPSYSEVIQGQYYEVGEEFKAHTDYFESHEMSTHAAQMGQRTFTFMIYLNTVKSGGETVFPKIKKSFKPEAGKAIIWNSLNRDGTANVNTLHHATPVKEGYKAIITKWFRSCSNQTPTPSMYMK